MSRKYFSTQLVALAGLIFLSAALARAQDLTGRRGSGFAADFVLADTDGTLWGGAAGPSLADSSPIGATLDLAASQNQDQGNSAEPGSPAANQNNVHVNPLTGLVSDRESLYTPLTGDERWKLYWKMNYDSMGAYFGPFFSALLLDQATGSPAQWGGGLEGYGKRVASRAASAIMQGSFQAPAAYLLHEDVRYIASKRPGFRHRAAHAIAYSFLTYNNSGHPTLNIANLGAYYASTAVTTAWLPGHYKVLSYTLTNSTEQIGLTLPVNLLQEFWPEIVRTFHKH